MGLSIDSRSIAPGEAFFAITGDTHDGHGFVTAALKAGDRKELRTRVQAAVDQLKKNPHVDASKTAAIGYCFGGAAVLELARSGADVKGVVSFHGDLSIATPAQAGPYFLMDIDSFWTPSGPIPEYNRSELVAIYEDLYGPARVVFQDMLTDRLKEDLLRR